jgi:hypothetical protein
MRALIFSNMFLKIMLYVNKKTKHKIIISF